MGEMGCEMEDRNDDRASAASQVVYSQTLTEPCATRVLLTKSEQNAVDYAGVVHDTALVIHSFRTVEMGNRKWEMGRRAAASGPIFRFSISHFRSFFRRGFIRILASYSAPLFELSPPLYTQLFNAFSQSHRVVAQRT
jgi:hypothetical protein